MGQPGGEADLALEALGAERGGELWAEDLERHRTVVTEIARQVDRGHAPAAELTLDRVPALQGGAQFGGPIRHQSRSEEGPSKLRVHLRQRQRGLGATFPDRRCYF